jgi:hypothetical protein
VTGCSGPENAINFLIFYPPLVTSLKRSKTASRGAPGVGPIAGSSGLGLIVGILEGTLGGLVGAREHFSRLQTTVW